MVEKGVGGLLAPDAALKDDPVPQHPDINLSKTVGSRSRG